MGFGHTGPDVTEGLKITQAHADELLQDDLARFEVGVDKLLAGSPASDNQFAAMVCLAYNIGLGNFAASSVLKRHKLANYLGAERAFAMWNRAAGKILAGLTRRREAEARLYRS